VIGLAVVLAFSLLAAGCKGGGGAPQEASAPATPTPGSAAEPAAPTPPAGQPAAAGATKPAVPIEIVAYYPLNESHKFIADYVKSVEAANPGKITVSVYDMQSEEGRKKWMSSGLSCAGVFVNGKTSYELTTNGKKETVAFLQRMDVMWTHEDFETVLKQILDKAGQTFVSPKYVSPKPPATTGAAGANPEATPKAKPSGSAG
jgi:hypothetical protein